MLLNYGICSIKYSHFDYLICNKSFVETISNMSFKLLLAKQTYYINIVFLISFYRILYMMNTSPCNVFHYDRLIETKNILVLSLDYNLSC